jgi:hypothetical protein
MESITRQRVEKPEWKASPGSVSKSLNGKHHQAVESKHIKQQLLGNGKQDAIVSKTEIESN